MSKIAVLGTGSWGTAQAHHLKTVGHDVTIWGIEAEAVRQLNEGHNEQFFPGLQLARGMRATLNLAEALEDREALVLAVPAQAMREVARKIKPLIKDDTLLISTAKGLESPHWLRMTEVLSQEVGRLERMAVLSGPSFAVEVAQNMPTAVTVAAAHPDTAHKASSYYHSGCFRTYTSGDLVGVELCGVLKNVLAVAAGISDGRAASLNARAALLTRGLTEMRRIVTACGGRESTVSGLAGLGDLMLTATGDLSRNRRVGLMLGQGQKLQDILQSLGQVAEGVNSAKCCMELAEAHHIEAPIIKITWGIIEGTYTISQAAQDLFARSPKSE